MKEIIEASKNVFLISDTHFGQWFANRFFNRPFKNTKEMNKKIIDNWNKEVSENDIVIIVGDFYSGSYKFLENLIDQLNGEKVLIKGNHDFGYRYKKLVKDGRIEVYDKLYLKGDNLNILFSHIAMPILPKNTLNIHGHYHRKFRPFNLNKKHYFNVCVDHTDFKPVKLEEALNHYDSQLEWYEYVSQYVFEIKNRKRLNSQFLLGWLCFFKTPV